MFQRDYWSMDDNALARLAIKHNIAIEAFETDETGTISWEVFNRDYIIASLVGRDAALRTRGIVVMSAISILISIAALAVSIIKR